MDRQRLLFIVRFILLLGVFYVAISNTFSDRVLIEPFTEGIAGVAAATLRVIGATIARVAVPGLISTS